MRFAAHNRSVVLSIERRQVKKDVILENGVPMDCQSNLLPDTLGKFMVGRGDLTEEQNLAILAKSATTGQSFSDLLVTEGVVSPHDLYRILQQNLAKKLLDAFTWKSGAFRVSTTLPEVDSPLKVRAPQLVLTGISKFAPESEIADAMAPFEAKKFFVHRKPPVPLEELRLSKEHQEILRLLAQGKTISELQSETGADRNRALSVLYSLAVIGVAIPEDWREAEPEVDDEDVPDSDFAHAAPAASGSSPGIHPGERGSGRDPEPGDGAVPALPQARRVRSPGDQGRLDPRRRRESVHRLQREVPPARFASPDLQPMEEKARDLFVAGGRAFGELSNPETRNSLIGRRQSRFRQLSSEEARNAFAIKSEPARLRNAVRQGNGPGEAGKVRGRARAPSVRARLRAPERALPGGARLLPLSQGAGVRSEDRDGRLRETVRIDPECGLAYYYAGLIHADNAEFAEAEPLLQRAIKLMAPDRRPIEALKKLKAAEREKPKKRLFF